MLGREFVALHMQSTPRERQEATLQAVRDGHAVRWPLKGITVEHAGKAITFFASLDYLSIGTPDDFVRMPLGGAQAQLVADTWNPNTQLPMLLPTRKMVNIIWKAAKAEGVVLAPDPWGAPYGAAMMTMERIAAHNEKIRVKLMLKGTKSVLVAGHKKDIVLTNQLLTDPLRGVGGSVAIYGWHRLDGAPIQGPGINTKSHEITYDDYSHGVRLIDSAVFIDGKSASIWDVLEDQALAGALSDEGPLRLRRYPSRVSVSTTAKTDPAIPVVLKLGSPHKAEVARWQATLAGFEPGVGKADGLFGKNTLEATKRFQASHGLAPTGEVDPMTWAAALAKAPAQASPVAALPSFAPVPLPTIAFVPAKFFTAANRTTIDLIVMHAMQAPETPGTAESTAHYFKLGCPDKDGKLRTASCHYNVDCDSIVQSVHDADVAFHAPGTNHNGIGIEHAGFVAQTRDQWLDPYSLAMLKLSAALTAKLSKQYDIPLEWIDAEGLLAGKRGLTTHDAATKASILANKRGLTTSRFYNSKNPKKPLTDHSDPEPNFPYDVYVELVKAAAGPSIYDE